MGRARGLMETAGSWISGKSLQGGVPVLTGSLARRAPAPGKVNPCSRAGNTPHTCACAVEVKKLEKDIRKLPSMGIDDVPLKVLGEIMRGAEALRKAIERVRYIEYHSRKYGDLR